MNHIKIAFCVLLLPASALAYETVQPHPEATATVTGQTSASTSRNEAQQTITSDCSGNTITIVNTGTRIATNGGNAAGVTINGSSITVDGTTRKCRDD